MRVIPHFFSKDASGEILLSLESIDVVSILWTTGVIYKAATERRRSISSRIQLTRAFFLATKRVKQTSSLSVLL